MININDYKEILQMNDLEVEFFNVFFNNLPIEISKFITLNRMSDKSLNVEYKGMQVGRIKLQGRKYWMQLLLNLYDVKVIENDFINHIEIWLKYIYKYLLRT